jgi:hypothetical protein
MVATASQSRPVTEWAQGPRRDDYDHASRKDRENRETGPVTNHRRPGAVAQQVQDFGLVRTSAWPTGTEPSRANGGSPLPRAPTSPRCSRPARRQLPRPRTGATYSRAVVYRNDRPVGGRHGGDHLGDTCSTGPRDSVRVGQDAEILLLTRRRSTTRSSPRWEPGWQGELWSAPVARTTWSANHSDSGWRARHTVVTRRRAPRSCCGCRPSPPGAAAPDQRPAGFLRRRTRRGRSWCLIRRR